MMNGYGGGYRRGYGWGRPPVYPGARGFDQKRTWNVQNKVVNSNPNPGTTQAAVVIYNQPSTASGTVTVKNILLSANAGSATTQAVFWAIVYIPAGTATLTLNPTPGQALYPAQQFVMAQGSFIADANSEPVWVKSYLARKLNPGDQILFLSIGTNAAAYQMVGTVQYALGV